MFLLYFDKPNSPSCVKFWSWVCFVSSSTGFTITTLLYFWQVWWKHVFSDSRNKILPCETYRDCGWILNKGLPNDFCVNSTSLLGEKTSNLKNSNQFFCVGFYALQSQNLTFETPLDLLTKNTNMDESF